MTLRQKSYIREVKRITSITLLSLFLFNIVGYYFLFLISDFENRNKMQTNLLQSSLETIRISKSEIAEVIFKDGGKEISFNGEMYDVKSKSESGNYFIFNCKYDKKETSLLAGLTTHVKGNTDSNSSEKKKNNLSKNPVKDLFFPEKNNFARTLSHNEFPTVNCKLQTVNLPFPFLPPEVSFS